MRSLIFIYGSTTARKWSFCSPDAGEIVYLGSNVCRYEIPENRAMVVPVHCDYGPLDAVACLDACLRNRKCTAVQVAFPGCLLYVHAEEDCGAHHAVPGAKRRQVNAAHENGSGQICLAIHRGEAVADCVEAAAAVLHGHLIGDGGMGSGLGMLPSPKFWTVRFRTYRRLISQLNFLQRSATFEREATN